MNEEKVITVGMLKQRLAEMDVPDDMPVLVTGYEGEFQNIGQISRWDVRYNRDAPHWMGDYESCNREDPGSVEVVCIER